MRGSHRDDLVTLRRLLGAVPIGIGVGGRRRDLAFMPLDRLFRRRASSLIETSIGPIEIDASHAPERLLAYAFENVYRYYQTSPLGAYISDRRPEVFVDVGANLGFYSMVAQALGSRTLCFEPEPSHAAFLTRNSALVGEVYQVALSDTAGALPLYYNRSNPGATSLVASEDYVVGTGGVRVEPFDQVFDSELGDIADRDVLIKVDVEGHESSVVRGMVGVLGAGFRPVLWVEVRGNGSARGPGSWRLVYEVLSSFGYRMLDPACRTTFESESELDGRTVFDALFLP